MKGYNVAIANFGNLHQDPCRPLKQCCGSALVSVRIQIQLFGSMRMRMGIQGFDDQKFFVQKLQFTYP